MVYKYHIYKHIPDSTYFDEGMYNNWIYYPMYFFTLFIIDLM